MRNAVVEFAGKKIRIEEKRIGELEQIVNELFPESKGDIRNIELNTLLDGFGFEMLYDKLPALIPDITADDVKTAYMSELEEIVGCFVDVNFRGIKRLLKPLMNLAQAGLLAQKS